MGIEERGIEREKGIGRECARAICSHRTNSTAAMGRCLQIVCWAPSDAPRYFFLFPALFSSPSSSIFFWKLLEASGSFQKNADIFEGEGSIFVNIRNLGETKDIFGVSVSHCGLLCPAQKHASRKIGMNRGIEDPGFESCLLASISIPLILSFRLSGGKISSKF
jgi:hypothetical protein